MNTQYLKGLALTTTGVAVLSFDALLLRLIDAHSMNITFWRGLLLFIVIAAGFKLTNPTQTIFRTDWRYLRSAMLFAISSICFVKAVESTSVANVLVIISIQPLLAALLSWFLLGEKSTAITWLAIAIAFFGVLWVFFDSWQTTSASENSLTGDLFALFCGLALSAKFVNDRGEKQYSMVPALAFGGLIMMVFAFFSAPTITLHGSQWLWISVLCIAVVPFSFMAITKGLKHLPAAEVAMLMLLETIIGPLWVWLFIGLAPNNAALQGGSIIILTLTLHTIIKYKMDSKKWIAQKPNKQAL